MLPPIDRYTVLSGGRRFGKNIWNSLVPETAAQEPGSTGRFFRSACPLSGQKASLYSGSLSDKSEFVHYPAIWIRPDIDNAARASTNKQIPA